MKICLSLISPSPAERLWLWRQDRGLTGPAAAAFLGLGRNAYWDAEMGRTDEIPALPGAHRPSRTLLLRLARRRTGWGLRQTAKKVGVSHTTLLAWEEAGEAALAGWWEKKGFTFV